jgi:Flp pilus assembly protein TadB
VNWLWINIPLMAAFFLAMTGIPLWLVFKHPDRRPAPERQGQELPDSVAARYAAARAETAPMVTIKLGGEQSDGEYAVPSLVHARG